MKKVLGLFFIFMVTLLKGNGKDNRDFVVSRALSGDFAELCAVNESITYEFFLPFFTQYSPVILVDKSRAAAFAQEYMAVLLEDDVKSFYSILMDDVPCKVLVVAKECRTDGIVGFVIFHYEDALQTVKVELLEIVEEWRGHGVGRALVSAVWDFFLRAEYCVVDPIKGESNRAALRFYEKLGFQLITESSEVERLRCFFPAVMHTGVAWAPQFNGDDYYARYIMARPKREVAHLN